AGPKLLSLFGCEFADAYPALAMLCVGVVARALAGQREAILTVLGFQRGLFWISLATLCMAVTANLILTRSFGVMGAASAAALAAIFRSAALISLARVALEPTPARSRGIGAPASARRAS
ncbi:MAG: polysaccharide biosynthesis C-terminal domain-containing protein, partial [Hyphomicrobiales bacterium]